MSVQTKTAKERNKGSMRGEYIKATAHRQFRKPTAKG